MRKLGGILIAVLLLSGCAATPAAEPSATVEPAATFEDIETLDDGIDYAHTLEADTPGLAEEISQTARKLSDLTAEADLPFDVNNAIAIDLVALNADTLESPSDAETHLKELHRIADELTDAI